MTFITFNTGPPPSIGWWPTRTRTGTFVDVVNGELTTIAVSYSLIGALRWWNGKHWSVYGTESNAERGDLDMIASKAAAHKNEFIEWAERPSTWPQESLT
jgi:hypothetical protein